MHDQLSWTWGRVWSLTVASVMGLPLLGLLTAKNVLKRGVRSQRRLPEGDWSPDGRMGYIVLM
jgi:hypothetical protein